MNRKIDITPIQGSYGNAKFLLSNYLEEPVSFSFILA